MWQTAEYWGYVHHDPFRGIRLSQMVKAERPYFTLEEIRNILAASPEPYRTFYWLAAETGLRPGELWGLRWCEIGADVLTLREAAEVLRLSTRTVRESVYDHLQKGGRSPCGN